MKELENIKPDVILQIPGENKQHTKIGSQRKIKGLTTWEYNEATGELSPAEFESIELPIHGFSFNHQPSAVNSIKLKLIVNPNCQYIQALNKQNALRKLRISSQVNPIQP